MEILFYILAGILIYIFTILLTSITATIIVCISNKIYDWWCSKDE